MTKFYASDEALEAKGKEFFENLDLHAIMMKGSGEIDGIEFGQTDMGNYFFCAHQDDVCYDLIDTYE